MKGSDKTDILDELEKEFQSVIQQSVFGKQDIYTNDQESLLSAPLSNQSAPMQVGGNSTVKIEKATSGPIFTYPGYEQSIVPTKTQLRLGPRFSAGNTSAPVIKQEKPEVTPKIKPEVEVKHAEVVVKKEEVVPPAPASVQEMKKIKEEKEGEKHQRAKRGRGENRHTKGFSKQTSIILQVLKKEHKKWKKQRKSQGL